VFNSAHACAPCDSVARNTAMTSSIVIVPLSHRGVKAMPERRFSIVTQNGINGFLAVKCLSLFFAFISFWLIGDIQQCNSILWASSERAVFGIELNRSVAEMVNEIEKGSRKFLLEEVNPHLNRYGENSFLEDGTPVIRINPLTGRTLSTIVHEIFHVKMTLDGFHVFAFRKEPPENIVFMKWISSNLYDVILHWIIYPEMRSLGVEPSTLERKTLISSIEAGQFENLDDTFQRESLILNLFRVRLVVNDSDLTKVTTEWYKKRGWVEHIQVADEMANLVVLSNPKTPAETVETFLRCINVLFKNKATFEIEMCSSRLLGSVKQNFFVIKKVEWRRGNRGQ